ncbi:MAG: DUF421 domain-containing protein [Clostridia bacterium]|nr:DUF421 domain-containing protein [Clostridia bacterium]
MNYVNTMLTSLASIAVLFLLAKIVGNRQIAQLSLFDYICGITIGSIAAEMALAKGDDILESMVALVTYGLITVVIALLTVKSVRLRRLFAGQSAVLFDNGEFHMRNFHMSKIDLHEFLALLRNQGYFDLADVQTVLFEFNGSLSVLPKSTSKPLTPEDMQLYPAQDKLVYNFVIDGKIMESAVEAAGKTVEWVESSLSKLGHENASDVMLATCDANGLLRAYTRVD